MEGYLETCIRVIVQREARLSFPFRVIPYAVIFFRIFTHFPKLQHILVDGFVFFDENLFHLMNNGTVFTCMVMVKFQNTFAVRCNAYHHKSHAFAYSGQIEHTPVCCYERYVFLRAELFDGCCPVIVTSQQGQKLSLIFLVKLSQDFLFVLFLQ